MFSTKRSAMKFFLCLVRGADYNLMMIGVSRVQDRRWMTRLKQAMRRLRVITICELTQAEKKLNEYEFNVHYSQYAFFVDDFDGVFVSSLVCL